MFILIYSIKVSSRMLLATSNRNYDPNLFKEYEHLLSCVDRLQGQCSQSSCLILQALHPVSFVFVLKRPSCLDGFFLIVFVPKMKFL